MDGHRFRHVIVALACVATAGVVTPAAAAPGGGTPLAPPTSLDAKVTAVNGVTITWNDPNTRERGYQVERRQGTAPFAVIGKVKRNVTSFDDYVGEGLTLDYQVRALGGRGVVSAPSPIKTVKVIPADVTKPPVPQGVVAAATSCRDVKVTWRFVLDNPQGSGIAGYNVRRGAQLWFVPFLAPQTFTESGLQPATNYAYTVSARDNAGNESNPSAPASATTMVCGGDTVVRPILGTRGNLATANAIAPDGSEIVSGRFTGTVDFGGTTLTSNGNAQFDAYVAKYAPGGSLVWAKRLGGGPNSEVAHDVAVDAQGNVVVVGDFIGTANFGGGALTAVTAPGQDPLARDAFVAKYSPSGAHLWSKRYGDEFMDSAGAVTTDASGNIFVGGSFVDRISFGGPYLYSSRINQWSAWSNPYVAALKPNGDHLWSTRFTVSSGGISGIAVDAAGNLAITGSSRGDIDFGNGPVNLNDDGAAFVAKLSSTGKHVWSHVFGRYFTGDYGKGVAFDHAGNVVAVGTISGTIDIGGATLPGDGGGAGYAIKYSGATGAHMWSYSLGSRGEADDATSVAVDSADSVLVTGSFQDWPGFPAVFGGVTLKSTGGRDVFVAKYTSSGTQSWVRRFGGPDDDLGFGVSVDSAGGAHVVGVFTTFAEFDGHPLYGTALFGDAPYQVPTLDSFVMKLAP